MSALKKVKRLGKRASKFRFTCIVQSVLIELNTKRWSPQDLYIVWSRRARKYTSRSRPWEPSVINSLRGEIVWPEEEPMDFTVTFYKDSKSPRFESKEWDFIAINKDKNGKKKILAKGAVNMAQYTDLSVDTRITLDLKPVSKKIGSVTLDVGMVCELIKEGKATDEDMLSLSSMRSFSGVSDDVDDLEDDVSDHGGSRDDLAHSFNSPCSPSPYIPLPSEVEQEQVLLWAESVTKDYRNVKLVNLSTSWRNGMGFLAIIHHFKPELVDFASLSPLNIRDNNSLVRELCRSLSIPCPIKPEQMDSTALPNPEVIAGFVYQLFVHLDNGMPQTLPPLPVRRPSISNGDVNRSVRYELTPPGVRRQYSPQLSKASAPIKTSPLFNRHDSPKVDVHVNGNSSTMETVSNNQNEIKSPRQPNSSPDGIIIEQYSASPMFGRRQCSMYGNVVDDDGDSSDEDNVVVKVSDIPFSPTPSGDLEEGKVPPQTDEKQKSVSEGSSSGKAAVVSTVLNNPSSDKDVFSDGSESTGIGSPPSANKISLSDINLEEVRQAEGGLSVVPENGQETVEPTNHSRVTTSRSTPEERRKPVSSPAVANSPKRSLPGLPSDKKRKLPSLPVTSPRNRSASLPFINGITQEVVKTKGEASNQVSNSPGTESRKAPPRPTKERRKGSVDTVLLEEFESLPVRRLLPQPRHESDSAEEPFERPATAEVPRSEEALKTDTRLKKVGSVDLLSDQSPPTSRRRRQQGGPKQLTAKGLSDVTPSLSALNVASQPPKTSSEANIVRELEASYKEECVEDLAMKKGSLTRGLLKGVQEDTFRDQLSPPIAEENEQDSSQVEDTEDDNRLRTKVEYHQEKLESINKEIQEAEKAGELVQIDLNNARSRSMLASCVCVIHYTD